MWGFVERKEKAWACEFTGRQRYFLKKIHDLKKLKFHRLCAGDMSFCYFIHFNIIALCPNKKNN